MPRPIVMDVDTGTDDALALLYAVAHPDLDLLGVSCVAGNAGLDQVVRNTLQVLDAAGAADVPVAAGAARPLIARTQRSDGFHGSNGLGGIELPATARTASPLPAVELLRLLIEGSADPVTLVGTAPQTNLALLVTQHPETIRRLDRVVFMGGSASVGNVTALAEFNVWQDPEAAACVVQSGAPTAMYGLDVFTRLLIPQFDAERLAHSPAAALRLAGELLFRRGSRSDGTPADYLGVLGDSGALVYLTNPELFTVERRPVRVNLTGLGRGQTVVDRRNHRPDASVDDPWPVLDVVLDLDAAGAAAAFVQTIETYAATA